MSFVHYKFKSAKDYDTITFEGTGLPLWELKREIVQAKKLGHSGDFDLVITNAQTNEEYKNESQLVHKNISVIVKRVPAVNKSFKFTPKTTQQPVVINKNPNLEPGSEEAKIEAMMNQSSAAWSQTSDALASGMAGKFLRNNPQQRLPPTNYVCFRCGLKGHYIQFCPTNTNKDLEVPRVKKTTGIPKTFLKTIDPLKATGKNVMVNPDGGIVEVRQNTTDWDKLVAQVPMQIPSDLCCPSCHQMLRNAVLTPCCSIAYCEDCVTASLEDSPECPNCHKELQIAELKDALEIREKVTAFISGNEDKAGIKKESGKPEADRKRRKSQESSRDSRDRGSSVASRERRESRERRRSPARRRSQERRRSSERRSRERRRSSERSSSRRYRSRSPRRSSRESHRRDRSRDRRDHRRDIRHYHRDRNDYHRDRSPRRN